MSAPATTCRALAIALIVGAAACARAAAPVDERVTLAFDGVPPVQLRLILPSEFADRASRYVSAAELALQRFGDWYGPYPDAQLTLVDAGHRDVPAYSGDIVVHTHALEAGSSGALEAAVIDGIARRIWSPRTSGEQQRAVLDGIGIFSAAKALRELYPDGFVAERRYFGGLLPFLLRGVTRARGGAVFGVHAQRSPQDRAAAVIATLERYIGWGALQAGLSTFAERRRRSGEGADLFAILTETTGRNLQQFQAALTSAAVIDYSLSALTSNPMPDRPGYLTTITLERNGAATFTPTVDLAVDFEDGSTIRERWDGREPSAQYEFESRSPAVSATLDPDQVLVIDGNPANNHASRQRARGAAAAWAARWSIWLEDLLLTYSALF